ncbi:MAG: ftsB [Gammaproteobacteria bacterium]|jgi:cell division protein FtsB|nr:ftsB [Gammaproteobacteria bacterium]
MKALVGAAVILFILLQYQLWFKAGGIPDLIKLKKQVASLQDENAGLHDQNAALEAEVQDLKQGHAAIEERARNELGLVKEDELFYQIVDKPS